MTKLFIHSITPNHYQFCSFFSFFLDSLAHTTSEPVLWPFASLSRTRMGRAPGFVIVGFAEHEPVFTAD